MFNLMGKIEGDSDLSAHGQFKMILDHNSRDSLHKKFTLLLVPNYIRKFWIGVFGVEQH